MRRYLIPVLLLLSAAVCNAQTDFQRNYERQVRNVGYSGVGVETILDGWEAAEPDNIAMKEGRINYYFNKGQRSEVIVKDTRKYLGAEPLISVRDSLGRAVNYFEVTVFDDEQFTLCQKYIDKCIADHPHELLFRENKISTLMAYEKESPDLAFSQLSDLVAQYPLETGWTLMGEPETEEDFINMVEQYCYAFYLIGTPAGYRCFRDISSIMLKSHPKNVNFINNIGSYYLVAEDNPKQAVKYYKKALKIEPDNSAALQNMRIAEKRISASKAKAK